MKIPQLPPLLVKKSPSAYYVYVYKNQWDSQKKRSFRAEQKKVGTILGKEKEGKVRWSPEFIEQYPELEVFSCERKDRKWIFTPCTQEGLTLKQALQVQKVHAGATWALDQIVNNSPLGRSLARVFNKNKDYLRILSLAYFLILTENNNVNRYDTFSEHTRLPWLHPLSASAISRLFSRIRPHQIEEFFRLLQSQWKKQKVLEGNSALVLALDSTSISSYSEQLVHVARGKNKDKDELPQVNLLMLVDAHSGLPVFYREYDGNVPDVSTIRRVISDNARLDLREILLVSDKGYSSNKNIEDCLRNDVDFLFNMKCGLANSLTQEIIDDCRCELADLNNRDRFTQVTGVSKEVQWRYERNPIKGKKALNRDTKSLYYYVYFDEKIAERSANLLKERIDQICRKIEEKIPLDENEQRLFEEVFILNPGNETHYRINNAKVNEKLAYKGYRVLLSSKDMGAREAWIAYQDRWVVEDTFKTLKSRLGCSRLRASTEASVQGKIFVQFLATSIMMMVRSRLKKYAEDKSKKDKLQVIYQSDGKVLAELNNIMQTRFNGGYYFSEIAGKKKKFFEALGVPVPDAEPEELSEQEDTDPDDFKSEVIA